MFKNFIARIIVVLLYFYTFYVHADNPLVKNAGIADPHIHIFDGKAYMYSTIDVEPNINEWVMPEWKIWSSDDLVDWKLETTIKPTETYIGESDFCWAPDAAQRNGKTYFYFSNHNKDTGVMASPSPVGPFTDVLGKPMLPKDLTPIKEYDISVLTDTDEARTPYILFGHYRDYDEGYYYMIARLAENMTSLAETPKRVIINGKFGGNDKPNLHKRGDTYYLSAGAKYAMSKNIYGPYEFVGYSGGPDKPYGLSDQAHGNYFEWRNQWFHVWCQFVWGKEVARFRESKMSYLHYKDDGTFVNDIDFLDKHYKTGVGQYDADWEAIQAEWYMGAWDVEKREKPDSGFELRNFAADSKVFFPNMRNIWHDTNIEFHYRSHKPVTVIISEGDASGYSKDNAVLGRCKLPPAKEAYSKQSCELINEPGTKHIYFTFENVADSGLALDAFRFWKLNEARVALH